MFSKGKMWTVTILLMVLAAMTVACGAPAAAPTTAPANNPTSAPANNPTSAPQATAAPQATSAPTSAPQAAAPKGTLTLALTTDIGAIEVPYAAERNAANASWTMYDSLIYPKEDGSLQPALAEKWDVSADGRSYTFQLRKDVTFHNGEPFNADAVVFTWNTYKQKEVTYSNFWTIADNVEKVDDYTVKVSTKEPNALLLTIIALNWAQIPPKYYQQVGAKGFAQKPVGTGPFVFKEWVKADHLTVTANPSYWRKGFPLVQTVVFKPIPESSTRVSAIKKGEVDVVSRLTAEEANGLQGDSNVQVIRYPVDRVYYVAFNNITSGKDQPTMKPEVRQAMNYAVDKQAIIKSLFSGAAQPASGFIGSADLGYSKQDAFPYDVEKAKKLLSDAGYANGFSINMACPDSAYPHINEVCEAIVGYLAKVGIKADLKIQESNAFWDLEAKQQLPALFVDSWSVTQPEAYGRVKGALGKGASYAAWYDPKMDALITQIAVTVDRDQRAQLYQQLDKLMRDDPPFVYLYYPETFEAVRSRVQGYKPRAAEDYFLWNVGVTDAK